MRKSGILLPVSSLPGGYGIGSLGREAEKFIDSIAAAGQSLWQILPLGQTGMGDSPYQSFSTCAGNPYFIDLDILIQKGWLSKKEAGDRFADADEVNYKKLYQERYPLLKKAYRRSHIERDPAFADFCQKEKWLEDYALFMALKDAHDGAPWDRWEEDLVHRKPEAIRQAIEQYHDEVVFYEFLQYEFYEQWHHIRHYANAKGIEIIGDIPIYVAYDSADTWTHPELFQLDENLKPTAIAGCPPDGFSADGQVWGNPLYRWDIHQKTGYAWWCERIRQAADLYDIIRIDHFRGFDAYYAIPYGDTTARRGHWEKGPGYALFEAIQKELPDVQIIAEDLGYLTDSVRQLVADCGYPGMKLIEFAFDSRDSSGDDLYMPYSYPVNCVVYTGTHDNETLMGWFKSIQPAEKKKLKKYLSSATEDDDVLAEQCIALALSSVGK